LTVLYDDDDDDDNDNDNDNNNDNNISTTTLKESRQKHSNWQLYSNEKNDLQQFQMESCQRIKRLKDTKKKNNIHANIFQEVLMYSYKTYNVGNNTICTINCNCRMAVKIYSYILQT